MTRHQDFDKIKVGDIIDFNDSSTGYGHAVFAGERVVGATSRFAGAVYGADELV